MSANLIAGNRDEPRDCLPAVVYQPINRVKLDPGNPRKHSKKQIGLISRSIKEFGFSVPILVDVDLKVIAGHGRLLAARQLGLSEVPTIALEHLTPEQAKAFAIAENRLGELSRWETPLLGERLRELSATSLSLDVTGFAIPKITLLIEGAPSQPDPADRMPRAQPGPAVCRRGDLWALGPHLVYCGSALDEPSYKVLLREDRAAMVFTEPLRNADSAGHVYELPPLRGERSKFLLQVCGLLGLYRRPGSLHYLCTKWGEADQVLHAGRQTGFEQVDLCVWAKDKPVSGSLYQNHLPADRARGPGPLLLDHRWPVKRRAELLPRMGAAPLFTAQLVYRLRVHTPHRSSRRSRRPALRTVSCCGCAEATVRPHRPQLPGAGMVLLVGFGHVF